jgi:radical SAM superfamily enzyme YgiQ (UPF0313 family)
MGVVLHHAMLADAGIRARVVRPLDPPFTVPDDVAHASLTTLTFDPPMGARLRAMSDAYDVGPTFFDSIVDDLLVGGERVIGLSVFRNNVDVSLQVAKLVKERRPSAIVVLGGPEAIEAPSDLLLPFVDVVVGRDAECIIVPLMRSLLEGRLDRAVVLRNVWLHEDGEPPGLRSPVPTPPLPVIDYTQLMSLFVGDPEPTVPMLLNWGCPYHCSYCSNRTTYGRFTRGTIERSLEEMDSAVAAWSRLHHGRPPGLTLQLSDGTTNAIARQLDALLLGVVEHRAGWDMRPAIRGQTLFDSRVTRERVHIWKEAGFQSTFFGLDAADDVLRRQLNRPGTLLQVRAAVETYAESGLGGLTFGVPVGVPGETEEHFARSCEFVDWAVGLGAGLESITVLPYVFFKSAQDPAFAELNRGSTRGLLWRSEGPGGDPAERGRRFMDLFDRIDGRVRAISPIPPYLALPAMLPTEDPARLEAWMDRHGRIFDQLRPGGGIPSQTEAPDGMWARALEVLQRGAGPRWRFEAFDHRAGELTAVFRKADGTGRIAVQVQRLDTTKRSFAQTRNFNVSYLREWRGMRCELDATWLSDRVRDLRGHEENDDPE